jgi:type IV pilus assembly protein PilB
MRDTKIAQKSTSAVSIIDSLLYEAYMSRASDIHLNPGAGTFIARMRVDGNLFDTHTLSPYLHQEILARLKILAGLRTDEHHAPQDGRFSFEISENIPIDVRISIAPTYYGENAVLRLLSSAAGLSTLAALGCENTQEALLRQNIMHPHGMILITGPTGSGKTSTLYALIQLLNTRATSIITIEDPIEYTLPGIVQIPANSTYGLSFAEGLRSILRQDPNVIGVGEIRDTETATLASNAALTGHLVLATLHTIDAPTALPRLMDMGIEPYSISSTVNVVINQRLVRRLCISCRTFKVLSEKQLLHLTQHPALGNTDISGSYESVGCKKCNGTGAIGRIGIFEIMQMNTGLREAVARKASARELRSLATSNGMEALCVDGLKKAARGLVSVSDVLNFLPFSI